MRHNTKKIKLRSAKGHQRQLLRNLAMSLIIHEKIKTTEAKARAVKSFVEELIQIAKTYEKREAIRKLESELQHEDTSKKLLEVLKEKYAEKEGGYTRTTKLGYRNGDNAPVVQIELTD